MHQRTKSSNALQALQTSSTAEPVGQRPTRGRWQGMFQAETCRSNTPCRGPSQALLMCEACRRRPLEIEQWGSIQVLINLLLIKLLPIFDELEFLNTRLFPFTLLFRVALFPRVCVYPHVLHFVRTGSADIHSFLVLSSQSHRSQEQTWSQSFLCDTA
jgi:hypothetical protein